MNEALAYLTVLVAAAIPLLEVLLVVPAGVLAGLPPGPTVLAATVGNVATVVPVVLAGDRLRSRLLRRRGSRGGDSGDPTSDGSGRRGRARRVFDRYGLPGLALIGPVLTGAHVAAAMAMAAGARRRPALVWLPAGIAVWAGIAGALTALGVEALIDPDALPDLGLD